jgi:hypothetical protein
MHPVELNRSDVPDAQSVEKGMLLVILCSVEKVDYLTLYMHHDRPLASAKSDTGSAEEGMS